MTVQIIRGDALALPLPDGCVDLVCTSPPYFGLRSYQDDGVHYAGQLGSEATPAEFVDALVAATREMVRVLKPAGSIWINLGDKYSGSNGQAGGGGASTLSGGAANARARVRKEEPLNNRGTVASGAPQKSLIGIPWRYALRCIDDLGLILRAEVIWSKPNGLPESVTDRVRRSHEQWFNFEQSGGVESQTQSFPFCPLCGRPKDARSTLVARLKKLDRGVEAVRVTDQMGSNQRVQDQASDSADEDMAVRSGRAPVPTLTEWDACAIEDANALIEDGLVAVVDGDAKRRTLGAAVSEANCSLSVDDAGEPSEVCTCVGHPLIIHDEPWIPQSLAADVMQRVADGEIDPQQAADFLSGDYVRNHSVWFHFTKEPRYFSAVDEIREAHLHGGVGPTWAERKAMGQPMRHGDTSGGASEGASGPKAGNPLGKLPGSVWTIPTQPLTVPAHLGVDHFAAFPMEWPRRIIAGWSPAGVCVGCGEGRRPAVDRPSYLDSHPAPHSDGRKQRARGRKHTDWLNAHPATITGYTCACMESTGSTVLCTTCRRGTTCLTVENKCPICADLTRPGVVLDPFGGTGTTALVAHVNGRHGISVDYSADYCRLARWRTTDPNQLAAAALVDKPPVECVGQESLFDLEATR